MDIVNIARKIQLNGGTLYLVGGALRDEIMGKEIHDRDYCVTGLEFKYFKELFPESYIIGKDFPVFMLNNCEFALARTERKVSKGYKGFKVCTSKDISIIDDLKRRDLTINAIAKNVLTGEIIDPFGGRKDILDGKIRHVSEAFSEDPLRAYRAARFAAKYDFEVVPETIRQMSILKDELKTIKSERVFEELKKALQTKRPSLFFKVLKNAGILDVHFKEINDLIGVIQPEKYHPEGDVFNHTMIVLDRVAKSTNDESVRFGALVHDLGKATTPREILPRHIGHEERGVKLVGNMATRLKLPNRWRKIGKEVARYHMKAAIVGNMRPYKQAMFLNQINRSLIGLDNLELIVNSDDMIGKEKVEFATKAKEVLNQVNGDSLKKIGITVDSVGKDEFFHKLYEEQAKIIRQMDLGNKKKKE